MKWWNTTLIQLYVTDATVTGSQKTVSDDMIMNILMKVEVLQSKLVQCLWRTNENSLSKKRESIAQKKGRLITIETVMHGMVSMIVSKSEVVKEF